jgi:hypothetical protein
MVDRTLTRQQAQERYLRDTPEGRRMMIGLGAISRPGSRGAPVPAAMDVPNVTLTPNELATYAVSPFARERAGLLGVRRGLFDVEGPEMFSGIPPSQLDLEIERERAIAAVPPQGREPSELVQALMAERATASRTPDIFALEGPEMGTEIANVLAEVTRRRGGRGGVGRPGVGGGFAPPVRREPEAPVEPEAAPEAAPEAPTFDPQTAFMDAIEAAMEAAGKDLPEVRDIDAYKKEFAEATGIDISGKPDKSAALMAFGLALMQNRAGSGFNVGNILRSIGEAGEKAMPALEKAKEQARTNVLAAGKFALESRTADRAKREAAMEKLATRQNYYIYPAGGAGASFENFDNGKLVQLNAAEVNQLLKDPQFQKNYDFIDGSAYLDVMKERAQAPDYGDKWEKSDAISLVGDKSGLPELYQVRGAYLNPNYTGPRPANSAQLLETPEVVVERLMAEQKAVNRAAEAFGALAADIQEGISIPEQAGSAIVTFGRNLGFDWGDGPTAINQAKAALLRIQATNAKDILGEVGKTLSDTDRQIVREVVGNIDLKNADDAAVLSKLSEVYNLVVRARQENLDRAFSTLDKQFGIKVDFGDRTQSPPTEDELAAINAGRERRGQPPLTMESFTGGASQ